MKELNDMLTEDELLKLRKEKNEKFFDKNKEKIIELNKIIDENSDELDCIIISPEFYEFLKGSEFYTRIAFPRYKNVRLSIDMNRGATKVSFAFKTDNMFMILPCICGIYPGEDHDWLEKYEKKITLPTVDPKKVRKMNEGVDSKD